MRMREGASNTDDGILSSIAYVCQIRKYLVVTWVTEGIIFFAVSCVVSNIHNLIFLVKCIR